MIANGDNDRMVPTVLCEDMHRRIAGSKLTIYPNSGHGAIFRERYSRGADAACLVAQQLGLQPKVGQRVGQPLFIFVRRHVPVDGQQ